MYHVYNVAVVPFAVAFVAFVVVAIVAFGTPEHVILNKNHEPFHHFLHSMFSGIPVTCISGYL